MLTEDVVGYALGALAGHVDGDVLVEVHRRRDVFVAQPNRESLDVHPASAGECRVGVAKIVESDLFETESGHPPMEALGLVLGVEHRPPWVGEDEVQIYVVTAERQALFELTATVIAEDINSARVQRDCTEPRIRLGHGPHRLVVYGDDGLRELFELVLDAWRMVVPKRVAAEHAASGFGATGGDRSSQRRRASALSECLDDRIARWEEAAAAYSFGIRSRRVTSATSRTTE